MKQSTKQIRDIADKICRQLVERGVVVQRYEAFSTNSIYLKFDCGLANSLRIGDHRGKQHLSYMFMVDVNYFGNRKKIRSNYTQYIYSPSKKQIKKLIDHILIHRSYRIESYGGYTNYREQMKCQYIKNRDQKGFWSQAKFISKEKAK